MNQTNPVKPESKSRLVRVLTYGKTEEAIDEAIVSAIQSGSRVLVKAARPTDTLHLDTDAGVIADWAEKLSQTQGLVWHRVGLDVLFARATA